MRDKLESVSAIFGKDGVHCLEDSHRPAGLRMGQLCAQMRILDDGVQLDTVINYHKRGPERQLHYVGIVQPQVACSLDWSSSLSTSSRILQLGQVLEQSTLTAD